MPSKEDQPVQGRVKRSGHDPVEEHYVFLAVYLADDSYQIPDRQTIVDCIIIIERASRDISISANIAPRPRHDQQRINMYFFYFRVASVPLHFLDGFIDMPLEEGIHRKKQKVT